MSTNKTKKKIEKLETSGTGKYTNEGVNWKFEGYVLDITNKINEIIDYLNENTNKKRIK